MKNLPLISTITCILLTFIATNLAHAASPSSLKIKDTNTEYVKCMRASPVLDAINRCNTDMACQQATIQRYLEKESYELNCLKKFEGEKLVYTYTQKT
ncbi:hypothetical protein MNBD_GAMMA08-1917 [hydrothermal vent metagenome]|uniref:Uncharacterized protein n=1 Tax=hydrothermal vent metagenome TaxID=652676 RepID=A0A3B0WVP6_9ZZZZ